MRRILFGGLVLTLGVIASPAVGQDGPAPAPTQRAARLGQPVAIPDQPATDTDVTPAGLFRRRSETILAPGAAPPPPAGGVTIIPPVGGRVPRGAPVIGGTLPQQPSGASPKVVEDRGATKQGALANQIVVPSVVPEAGVFVPQSGLDAPLYGGGDAVGRVVGCGRWRVSGEYLMWWTRAADLPALVTTSSPQFNGQLGVGDTRVLVADGFGQTFHSGARLSAVRWFGHSECRGLDARIFFLGQASSSFTATTGQFPLLARPFINVNPGTPFFGSDSQIVGAPGLATGGVTVELENGLWGLEANYRRYLCGNGCRRVDALVGYRYLNMTERLQITENFARTPNSNMGIGAPATMGVVIDNFRTENQFHGGQVGLAGEWRRGRWSLDARGTIALGTMFRTAEIDGGQSLVLADGTVANFAGGLLALQGANIGRYSDSAFAVVPEVGVNVGYQLTSRLRVFVGYNFLYLSSVLRPGDVIDPYVDAARIPNFLNPPATPITGMARPAPQIRSAGFFVQGINFGLRYDW